MKLASKKLGEIDDRERDKCVCERVCERKCLWAVIIGEKGGTSIQQRL